MRAGARGQRGRPTTSRLRKLPVALFATLLIGALLASAAGIQKRLGEALDSSWSETAAPGAIGRKSDFGIGEDSGWITHSGTVPGYNSDFGYLPKLKASIVVLTNTDIEAEPRSTPSVAIMAALSAVVATPDDASTP